MEKLYVKDRDEQVHRKDIDTFYCDDTTTRKKYIICTGYSLHLS